MLPTFNLQNQKSRPLFPALPEAERGEEQPHSQGPHELGRETLWAGPEYLMEAPEAPFLHSRQVRHLCIPGPQGSDQPEGPSDPVQAVWGPTQPVSACTNHLAVGV